MLMHRNIFKIIFKVRFGLYIKRFGLYIKIMSSQFVAKILLYNVEFLNSSLGDSSVKLYVAKIIWKNGNMEKLYEKDGKIQRAFRELVDFTNSSLQRTTTKCVHQLTQSIKEIVTRIVKWSLMRWSQIK